MLYKGGCLMKAMIILNPTAGKGSAKRSLFEIIDELNKQGIQPITFTTQYSGHAKDIITKYGSNYPMVICCGGDGTLNEVVSGMMNLTKRPSLGYLPKGTANDFAFTLKLTSNTKKMMQRILGKTEFPCDIGSFNHKYFTYVAGFGAFTDVSYTTPQQSKNMLGKVAYFLEGFKHLPSITSYHLKITYGDSVIEDDFAFGTITNAKSVGGMQSISTKVADLQDGLFEVLLIRLPNNPLDLQVIITALLKQEINERWMCFFKTDALRIESDDELKWTLDGEEGGIHHDVYIENKNKAITFLV